MQQRLDIIKDLFIPTVAPVSCLNPSTPNDHYSGRTAPLTSKRCILYIYSTNTGTEYFKHGIYSPLFFSSKYSLFHNFKIFGSCFIHILYTECANISKNNSGAKRLKNNNKIYIKIYITKLRNVSVLQLHHHQGAH